MKESKETLNQRIKENLTPQQLQDLKDFYVERLQEFSDGSNPILIEEAWNEAEELNTSLRELNDSDLVDCRQSLIDRTNRIMEALNEIGTEE